MNCAVLLLTFVAHHSRKTLRHKKQTKNQSKQPEIDIRLKFCESDAKIEGVVCYFAQSESIKRQSLLSIVLSPSTLWCLATIISVKRASVYHG